MMAVTGAAISSYDTPGRRAARHVRVESTRQPSDGHGRPLPVAGVFSIERTGQEATRLIPSYQIDLIQDGHRLLPAFFLAQQDFVTYAWDAGELAALAWVRDNGLPMCFITTQFERVFYEAARYSGAAFANNPIVYDLEQVRDAFLVDPLGPLTAWTSLGADWHGLSSIVDEGIETLYPNPPHVIIYSNNEGGRHYWVNANDSYRYDALYGQGSTEDQKRKRYGDGWSERYTEFFDAFRGQCAAGWDDVRFVGYNAGALSYIGRWSGWPYEGSSLHSGTGETFRLDWNHEAWDGASPQDYLDHFRVISDFQMYSVQVEAQNNKAAIDEAQATDPDYWNEVIVWDGYQAASTPNKREWWATLDPPQTFTPTRYGGLVQFCMWLSRPRVVREFRNTDDTQEDVGFDWFATVVAAVDVVHTNPTLRRFWRHGTIVLNPAQSHPFATDIPSDIEALDRWWMLTADVNDAQPWTLAQEIKVFAIAHVIGSAPTRQWLVYAHSPRQARTGVVITVPGYGNITVDVAVAGSFYVVDEATETVTAA